MIELKPCPFCGGEADFIQTAYGTADNSSVRLQFAIRCKKCDASAPNACGYIAINLSSDGELNTWHDDRNPAIAAWNRRANADMTSIEDSARMRGFEEGYLQGVKDGRANG